MLVVFYCSVFVCVCQVEFLPNCTLVHVYTDRSLDPHRIAPWEYRVIPRVRARSVIGRPVQTVGGKLNFHRILRYR